MLFFADLTRAGPIHFPGPRETGDLEIGENSAKAGGGIDLELCPGLVGKTGDVEMAAETKVIRLIESEFPGEAQMVVRGHVRRDLRSGKPDAVPGEIIREKQQTA